MRHRGGGGGHRKGKRFEEQLKTSKYHLRGNLWKSWPSPYCFQNGQFHTIGGCWLTSDTRAAKEKKHTQLGPRNMMLYKQIKVDAFVPGISFLALSWEDSIPHSETHSSGLQPMGVATKISSEKVPLKFEG